MKLMGDQSTGLGATTGVCMARFWVCLILKVFFLESRRKKAAVGREYPVWDVHLTARPAGHIRRAWFVFGIAPARAGER